MSELTTNAGLIVGIDHLAVATHDLAKSAEGLANRSVISAEEVEIIEHENVALKKCRKGSLTVELLTTYRPSSGGIARFLANRGPGLHHVALECVDLSLCLKKLVDCGIRTLPNYPADGSEGTRVAFLQPNDTNGLLIELVEKE